MKITEFIEKNPAKHYLLLLDNKGEIVEKAVDLEDMDDIFLVEQKIAAAAVSCSLNNEKFLNNLLENLQAVTKIYEKNNG